MAIKIVIAHLAFIFSTWSPITIPYNITGKGISGIVICLDSICNASVDLSVKKLHYPNGNYLHIELSIKNEFDKKILLTINDLKINSRKFAYTPHDIRISGSQIIDSIGNRSILDLSETAVLPNQKVTFIFILRNETYKGGITSLKRILKDEKLTVIVPSLNLKTRRIEIPPFEFYPVIN